MAPDNRRAPTSSLRCFVAVSPDAATECALRRLIDELAATGVDVRWSRGGLHVTLKFLGEVEHERLEAVHQAVRVVARQAEPFDLEVRGLGAFPSLRRPNVLWAAVVSLPLAVLAGALERALEPLGFNREPRPFRGHITLGRMRSPGDWKKIEPLWNAYLDLLVGRCRIDSLVIFRSTLQPTGSLYTPLWTVPLGND